MKIFLLSVEPWKSLTILYFGFILSCSVSLKTSFQKYFLYCILIFTYLFFSGCLFCLTLLKHSYIFLNLVWNGRLSYFFVHMLHICSSILTIANADMFNLSKRIVLGKIKVICQAFISWLTKEQIKMSKRHFSILFVLFWHTSD